MTERDPISKLKEEENKLIKKGKAYDELIVPINAIVKNVNGKTWDNYSSADNNHYGYHIGQKLDSRVKRLGQSSKLEIILEKNPNKIESLEFNGYAPIKKGDNITAYIFKGAIKITSTFTNEKKVLIERDFQEKEIANKIEILYKDGSKDIWETTPYYPPNKKDILDYL